jgi:hypothetical protein
MALQEIPPDKAKKPAGIVTKMFATPKPAQVFFPS